MAAEMFLKIGKIKGESNDKDHKDQIEIKSWNWGMTQAGTFHAGRGGGGSKVSVNNLTCNMLIDSSLPSLMTQCCTGEHVPEATLFVRKSSGKAPLDYLTINMKKVIISSVVLQGTEGPGSKTAQIGLNFAKVEVNYTPQNDDGSGGSPIAMTWDIPANTQ
jgi:type VI secretion system secreted protein Hcp